MNVGNALKLTCLGLAGGFTLRLIDMLYFYNYETGFFNDGGLFSLIGMVFVILIGLIAAIMCKKDDKMFFGPFIARKNYFAALTAFASAAMLVLSAVMQFNSYLSKTEYSFMGKEIPQSSLINLIYCAFSVIFAVVQLISAYSFLVGRNIFIRARLMYVLGTVWAMCNLLFVFFYYSKSTSITENFYTVIGACLLTVTILNLSKLLAGLGGEKVARRLFMLGIPTVMLVMTYTASNLVVAVLGKDYLKFGEIPFGVQLANLSVGLFLLAFLFTFKKYSLKRKSRMSPEERQEIENRSVPRYKEKTGR